MLQDTKVLDLRLYRVPEFPVIVVVNHYYINHYELFSSKWYAHNVLNVVLNVLGVSSIWMSVAILSSKDP